MKLPFNINAEEVITALDNFEYTELRETGMHRISGGFAHATIFDYDDDYFDIELRYGVQSDCENSFTVEHFKMDRVTLKIEDC